MKLQKFSQSTFVIESNTGKRILIDPGKYNFEGGFKPNDFGKVDIMIVTHKHNDHFDMDAIKSISGAFGPATITNTELAPIFQKENIEVLVADVGDSFDLEGFKITCIRADHVVRDEHIINFGLVIEGDGKRIYHTSDTTLMDIELLPKTLVANPDVLCVPISNRGVVMGIDDALYFTNEIKPTLVIPMHYDSPKDKDRVHPEYFVNTLNTLKSSLPHLAKVQVKILGFGEELIIS